MEMATERKVEQKGKEIIRSTMKATDEGRDVDVASDFQRTRPSAKMRKGVPKRQEPLTGKQDARNDEDERDRKSGFLLGKEGNASRGQIVSESKGWEKMVSL